MTSPKKAKTTKKSTTSIPIPGTLSIEGPIPVYGSLSPMKIVWKYHVWVIAGDIQNYCNARGAEGWELVGSGMAAQAFLIFKQPK